MHPLGKTAWQFLCALSFAWPYDPAVPRPVINPANWVQTLRPMLVHECSSIICESQKVKTTQIPSSDEWIKCGRSVPRNSIQPRTRTDDWLATIWWMLNTSCSVKEAGHKGPADRRIPFMWNVCKKQIHRDRLEVASGWAKGIDCSLGTVFPLGWGKTSMVMAGTSVWMCSIPLCCTL